jgi:hypothetical protein
MTTTSQESSTFVNIKRINNLITVKTGQVNVFNVQIKQKDVSINNEMRLYVQGIQKFLSNIYSGTILEDGPLSKLRTVSKRKAYHLA